MYDLQQARTVTVKACIACSAALLERDRFCRLCGTRQPESKPPQSEAAQSDARSRQRSSTLIGSELATTGLEPQRRCPYRSVSGPLVEAVVAGVTANTTSQLRSRFLRRAILALISVPIWLIILLLSPLDAYVAARSLSGDVQSFAVPPPGGVTTARAG